MFWGDGIDGCGKMTADHLNNSDKTILFADDDGQLQKFVAALLDKCGYKVIVAGNGNRCAAKGS